MLEYFNSTHGARKGLADTALKTANSGYLTRRLVDVAQDCIITELDCGTENGLYVEAVIEGGEVIEELGERILGRHAAENIVDPVSGDMIVAAGSEIDEKAVDGIETAGLQGIMIRSVLTCDTQTGTCAACYGRDLARGTAVNIGEAVGVIAAQSIGEPGTQLTMRTFHIGGTAQVAEQSFLESNHEGTLRIDHANVVKDSSGRLVVMSRNCQLIVLDENGGERAMHKVPYGSRLLIDDGGPVAKGQRMAEWDPYTMPIITEREGVAKWEDVVDGVSARDEVDETTGIATKHIADWRASARGNDLKPAIALVDEDGEVLKLANGNDARYPLAVDAILSIADGTKVHAGDVLARIPSESAKTRDITGGLPRVAELFEARKPKDHAVIAEVDGTIHFEKDYKNKRRVQILPVDEDKDPIEYLLPKGKHIAVHEGDFVQKGEYIIDGNPSPHDILRILGVQALANYLVNEIQEVYRLQGVKINDKHIEVIVSQMMQKVEVTDPADSTLLIGEQVDRLEFEEANEKALAEGGLPAQAHPVLLGITKASLQTRSFISAASFQETTRVLTEASVNGKVDSLHGLKENVIVGRLIPAGTGAMMKQFSRVAKERDSAVIEQRRASAAAAAPAAGEALDIEAVLNEGIGDEASEA